MLSEPAAQPPRLEAIRNLLATGQLDEAVHSADDVRQWVLNAESMLADAKRTDIGTHGAIVLAYEAFYCLALAVLMHHRVRAPEGRGHRAVPGQLLVPLLSLEAALPRAGGRHDPLTTQARSRPRKLVNSNSTSPLRSKPKG